MLTDILFMHILWSIWETSKHFPLPLFLQFALNLSNLSLVSWCSLLALYENQSNCTCNKLITFSSSCRILRASDICVDCVQLITSQLEYMLNQNQNQNRNGNRNQKQIQLAGNLKGSSVSASVSVPLFLHSPHAPCLIPEDIMKLGLLSFSICRLSCVRRGRLKHTLALLYFQMFCHNFPCSSSCCCCGCCSCSCSCLQLHALVECFMPHTLVRRLLRLHLRGSCG